MSDHWNSIFETKPDAELGWYEADAEQTLRFINNLTFESIRTIFLPGAGTSVLVEALARRGHRLILNDISDLALHTLKTRLQPISDSITWLHHDIALPLPAETPQADCWIDRAVLHFLREEAAIDRYFLNLKTILRPGGYVLLAEFSTSGASHCAGLELHRYSLDEMTERLGPEFSLVTHEDYTFLNPFGEPRPYIYALYAHHK